MNDDARRAKRRRVWRLVGGAVIAVIVAVLSPAALWQAVIALATGWIPFLRNTVPQMTVDWPQVWLTLAALAVFVAGLHRFLRWLLSAGPAGPVSGWQFRWTAAVATIVLFMFVAGTAMVGVVHQVAWLARSDLPLTRSSFSGSLSQARLRAIGSAATVYDDERGVLPAEVAAGARPRHGWMTALLPFIGESELFARVLLDEPWDTAANAAAFATRVQAYENPAINHNGPAPAPILADYAANALVIGPGLRTAGKRIEDGASRTILAGEVVAGRVPWGRPGNCRDPRRGIDAASPEAFGGPWDGGVVNMLFADGHVETVGHDIDPRVLEALATPAGGEAVPQD